MTNSRKPMPKKPPGKGEEPDNQNYIAVAVVFFVLGVAMVASETTRITGVPFIVIGITFFIVAQGKSAGKK